MSDIDRRSTFALGLMTVAFAASTAAAQTSGGREIAPGVRVVDLGERESILPAYKKLKMRDVVIQPGSARQRRDERHALPHDGRRVGGAAE